MKNNKESRRKKKESEFSRNSRKLLERVRKLTLHWQQEPRDYSREKGKMRKRVYGNTFHPNVIKKIT